MWNTNWTCGTWKALWGVCFEQTFSRLVSIPWLTRSRPARWCSYSSGTILIRLFLHNKRACVWMKRASRDWSAIASLSILSYVMQDLISNPWHYYRAARNTSHVSQASWEVPYCFVILRRWWMLDLDVVNVSRVMDGSFFRLLLYNLGKMMSSESWGWCFIRCWYKG